MKVTWSVDGMSCEHCARAVREAALSVDGVREVQVDLQAKSALLEYDEGKADLAAVKAAIEAEDFSVTTGA